MCVNICACVVEMCRRRVESAITSQAQPRLLFVDDKEQLKSRRITNVKDGERERGGCSSETKEVGVRFCSHFNKSLFIYTT